MRTHFYDMQLIGQKKFFTLCETPFSMIFPLSPEHQSGSHLSSSSSQQLAFGNVVMAEMTFKMRQINGPLAHAPTDLLASVHRHSRQTH